MNIFLIGPTGVGKTTVAHMLGQHYHQTVYDSDAVIAERAGMTIADIFSQQGEAAFRETEEKVIDELSKKKDVIVAVGAGAVLSRLTRGRLRSRGTSIYLCARPNTLEQHLEKNHADRPLLAQQPLLPTLKKMHQQRHPLYDEAATVHVNVDGLSVKQTVLAITDYLQKA